MGELHEGWIDQMSFCGTLRHSIIEVPYQELKVTHFGTLQSPDASYRGSRARIMSKRNPATARTRGTTVAGVSAVRAIDLGALQRRLGESVPGAQIHHLRQLVGGASGLTYAADLATAGESTRVVIKVAPPGLEPKGNRDMVRQARILQLLAGAADVTVPPVLAIDAGAPPEIPPLYIMSLVPGESYEPQVTVGPTTATPSEIAARAFAAARMAASLHAVRTDQVSLASEPRVNLVDEVRRWRHSFSVVGDRLSAGSEEVARELLAAIPAAHPPSLVHGDYRLGNMLCSGPSINAIIDWEVWSIGDPRQDLAWLLLFVTPGHPHAARTQTWLPEPAELVAAYEQAAGARMRDLAWFGALARYKQAAASALIIRNNRKLAQPGIDLRLINDAIPKLLESALASLR